MTENKPEGKRKQIAAILSNYRFASHLMQQEVGRKYLYQDLLTIGSGVLAPFAAMAFPSAAITLIQGGLKHEQILLFIVLYIAALKGISIASEYFNNKQIMNYFIGRVHSAGPQHKHVLSMDFELLEKKEGQSKLRASAECLLSGNDYGIEAFLIQFPRLAMNTIGFLLYSCLVIQTSFGVFIFMIVTAFVLGIMNLKGGNYLNKSKGFQREIFLKRKKAFEETMDNKSRGDMILYQMAEWLCSKLYGIRDEMENFYRLYFRIERNTGIGVTVLNFVRDGIVYAILIGQIVKGVLSVSELVLLVGVIAGYSKWLQQILINVQKIAINHETISHYRAFLAYGVVSESEDLCELLPQEAHEIRFENVCYRYDGASEDVISNLSLTIQRGEKIALVGSNGAGKTTLVKLMTGLYKPTSGKIYIDGKDMSSLNQRKTFQVFSVVFQDMRVYACSIAENIACSLHPNRERVIDSLMKAGLWEKVTAFEMGMDTQMTQKLFKEGVTLSGGQNQKLMLARALYHDAPVLILDEPTAALDPLAESEMYETYSYFAEDKTSIFISHRLSSTRFCDRVCFLKNGCISELGSHETLMAQQGDYAQMFAVQSKYYQEDISDLEGTLTVEEAM